MKRMQIAVAWLMRVGIIVAFLLVITGGVFYLWQHGQDIIHYDVFFGKSNQKLELTSFPFLLIDFGVLVLLITQILRVALVGCFFVWIRDYKFSFISAFVFLAVLGIFV